MFFLVLAFVFVVFMPKSALAATKTTAVLSAPTIISPQADALTAQSSLWLRGVVVNDAKVAIYLDGVKAGYATVRNAENGTASWAFQLLGLKDGQHQIYSQAEKSGKTSANSAKIAFEVNKPYPAPVILEPVVNEETAWDRPWIVGLAVNGSTIRVYLDGKLDGEFKVADDVSGTANFRYLPSDSLAKGAHNVSAVAIGRTGKISDSSGLVSFEVEAPVVLASTQIVVPEDEEVPANKSGEVISEEKQELVEEAAVSGANDNSAGSEEKTVDTKEEPSSKSKQIIGWSILGAMVLGMVYQRRGTIGKMMKKNQSDKPDSNVQVITKENVQAKDVSWEPKDAKEGEEKDGKQDPPPPPPPPASQY